MSPRKRSAVAPVGPDIDLDAQPVHLADGTRLTEARAAQIAEEAMAHHYRADRPGLQDDRATGQPVGECSAAFTAVYERDPQGVWPAELARLPGRPDAAAEASTS